jgi:hypothetical protein
VPRSVREYSTKKTASIEWEAESGEEEEHDLAAEHEQGGEREE